MEYLIGKVYLPKSPHSKAHRKEKKTQTENISGALLISSVYVGTALFIDIFWIFGFFSFHSKSLQE